MSNGIFTPAMMRGGIEPVAAQLLQGNSYNFLATQVEQRVLAGDTDALTLVAVKIGIDATLTTLELSGAKAVSQEEKEVTMRAYSAVDLAETMAEIVIHNELPLRFFKREGVFRGVKIDNFGFVGDEGLELFKSLVAAPFNDVGKTAGGALRVIREAGIDEAPTPIIARSTGLLAIAGLDRELLKEANGSEQLGYPYIHRDNLRVIEADGSYSVTYSSSARQFMRQFFQQGSGCPSNSFQESDGAPQTVLEYGWQRMVNHLITDDATTDLG